MSVLTAFLKCYKIEGLFLSLVYTWTNIAAANFGCIHYLHTASTNYWMEQDVVTCKNCLQSNSIIYFDLMARSQCAWKEGQISESNVRDVFFKTIIFVFLSIPHCSAKVEMICCCYIKMQSTRGVCKMKVQRCSLLRSFTLHNTDI